MLVEVTVKTATVSGYTGQASLFSLLLLMLLLLASWLFGSFRYNGVDACCCNMLVGGRHAE